MISVQNLSVEFNCVPLFSGASFVINKKDKIALVGKNGAGKSTMLKIIAGLQSPSGGTVAVPADTVIGYLPQQMVLADSTTVRDEVKKAFSHISRLQAEIAEANDEIARRTDYDSPEYAKLIEHVTLLNEHLVMAGSDNCDAEMEKTLIGLGFERSDFDRPTSEFSGGWRMRIELAKLLLRRPDVLLLDEPTNHLDIESIQWLENFLKTKANAVMLVSHDRAFIDNITNRTIEISCGKIYDYSVNYSKFVELRKERVEQQTRAYLNQQKQIQDTEEFIERFRYKATKSVQVQSRIKQLAKLERVEVDEVDTSHLNLKFPPAPRSGDYPVIAEGVGKSYGDHLVFADATFTIKRGEKVAFVGKNGEGKSTMVKCIMGEISHTGTLKIGHNVKIGYFAQNQASLLDESLTVFETIDRVADFNGTVIVVSHDREFLDGLVSKVYEFGGGRVREHLGGIYDFLESRKLESLRELEQRNPAAPVTDKKATLPKAETAAPAISAGNEGAKLSYEEQKELARRLRKAEKAVADVEKEIADLEARIADLEVKLATPDGAADATLYEEHGELKKQLDDAMWRWSEASEALEQLQKQSK